MASETKTENIMLTGQTAYFKKNGSMVNRGTLDLANALSSRSYAEGYIGPNSILHGTDLALTAEYKNTETVMKSFMENNWEEKEGERTIYTNATKIKNMLAPGEENMSDLYNRIGFEYTDLLYIYTTGSANYIDTGINANSVYGIEFTFAPYASSSTTYNYGSYISGVLDDFTLGKYETTSTRCYLRWRGTEKFNNGTLLTGSTNTNKITILNNKVLINDTNMATVDTTLPLGTKSGNIHLWNCAGVNRPGPMYFRRLKLYGKDQTTLIADFIPIKDSNNVNCIYDTITKKCIYNSGTGSFSAGTVSNVKYSTELEYVETVGTNYIALTNTSSSSGILIPSDGFELDFMPLDEFESTDTTTKFVLCGATSSSTTYWYVRICDYAPFERGVVTTDARYYSI